MAVRRQDGRADRHSRLLAVSSLLRAYENQRYARVSGARMAVRTAPACRAGRWPSEVLLPRRKRRPPGGATAPRWATPRPGEPERGVDAAVCYGVGVSRRRRPARAESGLASGSFPPATDVSACPQCMRRPSPAVMHTGPQAARSIDRRAILCEERARLAAFGDAFQAPEQRAPGRRALEKKVGLRAPAAMGEIQP